MTLRLNLLEIIGNKISVQRLAQKSGHPSGASYRVLHAGATLNYGDTYILELVKTDGAVEHTVIGVMYNTKTFMPIISR
ncbi:MAG: hypothetical protein R3A44_01520 [Caldilineaceae bacterium]